MASKVFHGLVDKIIAWPKSEALAWNQDLVAVTLVPSTPVRYMDHTGMLPNIFTHGNTYTGSFGSVSFVFAGEGEEDVTRIAGPDMVPAAVMARRRERSARNEYVERRAIPTDLDDHWIPDDEPSWRRFLPRE